MRYLFPRVRPHGKAISHNGFAASAEEVFMSLTFMSVNADREAPFARDFFSLAGLTRISHNDAA
jgi:hypothetical protein